MATFSPTINVNVDPAISVTLTNLTYSELLNSLGNNVYYVNKFYFASTQQAQISQVMNYDIYDVNGNRSIQSLVPTISPYQFRNTLFYDVAEKQLKINGQSGFSFYMLPLAQMKITLYTIAISVDDDMDLLHPSNFETLQAQFGRSNLFQDFKNEI